MITQRYATIVVAAVAAGVGSYVATQAWQAPVAEPPLDRSGPICASMPCGTQPCSRSLAVWLGLSPQQARSLEGVDPTFHEESAKLEHTLFVERQKLADLFDSDQVTDAEVLEQVDRVVDASSSLEQRVARYLVALRSHLTPEQRARLYKRCAKGIRETCACQRPARGRAGFGGHGCGRPSTVDMSGGCSRVESSDDPSPESDRDGERGQHGGHRRRTRAAGADGANDRLPRQGG